MAISDAGLLYLGDYFKCQLTVISLQDNPGGNPGQTIKCQPGSSPVTYWKNNTYWDNAGCVGAVAVSPDGSHVYVSRWSSYKFSIIDASSGHLDREVAMPGKSWPESPSALTADAST